MDEQGGTVENARAVVHTTCDNVDTAVEVEMSSGSGRACGDGSHKKLRGGRSGPGVARQQQS
jgi:hypothetical protein